MEQIPVGVRFICSHLMETSQMFTRNTIALAVGAFSLATSGFADARGGPVKIYGGGSSLPAIAYVGTSWSNSTPDASLTSIPDAGSLFAQVASSVTASYCRTGIGLKVFIGGQTTTLNGVTYPIEADGSCPATGFSAPAGQFDPNFVALDTPMSSSEYTTFLANQAEHIEPVQLPAIVGSVAIEYNNADVTSTLNLTDAQICGIFDGQINNWSQLGFPAKPITVVYRSDSSGTTFSFTNHLAKVCNSSALIYNTNSTFASAYFTGYALPAGAVGKSGNPLVATTIPTIDGAIGYAEYAEAKLELTNLGLPVTVANVNGFNPATPSAAFLSNAAVLKADSVLASTNQANGQPAVVTLASLGIAPTVANCLYLIDPASYATSTTSYPIVAVSNLLAYQKVQTVGTSTTTVYKTVQTLMKAPYNTTYQTNVLAGSFGAGYAFLPSANGQVGKTLNGRVASCVVQ
jgi:phosphate transport system substrate-binding protein